MSNLKKLVLIDGNSLLYRGFFAMRALTTSAGQHTNAIYSFTMMLLTLLDDQKPDVMICAWDKGKTFRHDEYAEYKGTRKTTPPELTDQVPLSRELVESFNIEQVAAAGYEADDVIGTLATQGAAAGFDVVIVSGDLDALQLVAPNIRVMTTIKGVTDTVIYDEEKVVERYGLRPDQLADYRALKGDASDNIPGVPGIGEKTATTLLQTYGTAEEVLAHADDIKPVRIGQLIKTNADDMKLSKRLAIIVRDVPLPDVDLAALGETGWAANWNAVRDLFKRLEFRTLVRRLPKLEAGADVSKTYDDRLDADDYDPFADDMGAEPATPEPVREAEPANWQTVEPDIDESLDAFLAAVRRADALGLRLDTTDAPMMDAVLRGAAFATGGGDVWYVPCEAGGAFVEPVQALLENPAVRKVCHDQKNDAGVLLRYHIHLRGVVFDTEIGAYLLHAGRRAAFPLTDTAKDYANRELHPLDKKERKELEDSDIAAHERSETFAAADALLAVRKVQEPRLSVEGTLRVMETLELPVSPILAGMETTGMVLDSGALARMTGELETKIGELEAQIYEIAGETFSITSTKQLQEVLFEKLKVPANKKTKTGYSTGVEALEELAGDFPIVAKVLAHRGLMKLKNTYADAMPKLVREDTHRLHTTLNQALVATGRVSSSNPNLQNIPVRTEIGREIRRAFVAPPGQILVSADYSQIELRIFAHVTKDPALVAAFSSGEDIHKYTAGKMYGIPAKDVTSDMRRAAKTVNYAVIYGISEFALAKRLGIPYGEAKELKQSYLSRFPGVSEYIDSTVAFARENGYVQTLFGRRRYIPDINSRVFQFRQASERAAANMPVQGTSADIMKLAMVAVRDSLEKHGFAAKMLLQVHDELLFETSPDEVASLAPAIRTAMTGVYSLDAPLEVEVKTGLTWADVTSVPDEPDDIALEVL
ncbi:MAG: DNA polymerase I [Armatimonadetes bacterium]|nr:DNA polymerase I [Armatimonadota bacterium]